MPAVDAWLRRFPDREADLRELFEIHDALAREAKQSKAPTPKSEVPAASSSDPHDANLVAGTYRLDGEIGRGGMGVVYRAFDTRLQRSIAIKFLNAERSGDVEALERFKREAVTASSLNSPSVCTIYEFDHHAGHPFIAMELIDGLTLSEWAASESSQSKRLSLIAQAASALAVAHEAGVVHRDVKPTNLMIAAMVC